MRNYYYILFYVLLLSAVYSKVYAEDDNKSSGKSKVSISENPKPANPSTVEASSSVDYQKASLEAQLELDKAMRQLNMASSEKVIQKDFMMDVTERLSAVAIDYRSQARGVFEYLDSKELYKEGDLQYEDLMTLPIGLKKKFDGSNSTAEVGILKASFFADYAEITVFVRLKINTPNGGGLSTEREIFFGADKVKISKAGGVQSFNAILLGDFILPMGNWTVKLKGGLDIATSNTVTLGSTYCKIECGQFRKAEINAEIIFPRNVIVPLDPVTYEPSTDVTNRVIGKFQVSTEKGLNEIIAQAELDQPFALASFPKLGFILKKIVVDLSETSSEGVMFPTSYDFEGDNLDGNSNYWKGIYAAKFEILLPKEFKDKSASHPSGRKSISINEFLMSKSGVSGTLAFTGSVNNPAIALNNGDASTWAFSLYEFSVTFKQNKLVASHFQGDIRIPLAPDTPFSYSGDFNSDGNYNINVVTNSSYQLRFKAWRAIATISQPDFTMKVENGAFRPIIKLNGKFTIGTNISGTSDLSNNDNALFRVAEVSFQNLVLQTQAPLISLGEVSYNKNQSLAGFPVSISELKLTDLANGTMSLDIEMKLSLMANKLSASSGGQFLMKYSTDGGAEWTFNSFKLKKVLVNGDIGKSVSIIGEAEVYESAQKKGFKGQLLARIQAGNVDISGATCAEFGYQKEQQYHYWNVQMAATFSPSLALVTPFSVNGASLGIYHHMRAESTQGGRSSVCTLGSGSVQYVEDKTLELGVKGVLGLEAGTKEAFKGFAGLELVFGVNYGLQSVALFGEGTIMGGFKVINEISYMGNQYGKILDNVQNLTAEEIQASKIGNITADILKKKALTQYGDASSGQNIDGIIYAKIALFMNLKKGEEYFKANADVKVNAGSFIKGSGKAEIFVGHNPDKTGLPNEWWVYIGKAERGERLSLAIDAGIIKSKASGYFMLGYNIPDLPCPTEGYVLETFKDKLNCDAKGFYKRTCDTKDRQESINGTGLALGMDTQIEAGFNVGLYGKARAQIGFDINVKEYSGRNFCDKGLGDKDLGLNRWYAMGQVYAGLGIEVGIDTKVFGEIKLASGNAAVLLQMGIPNPTWGRGLLKLQVSFAGLIDISTSPELSFGDVCPEVSGIGNCNQ